MGNEPFNENNGKDTVAGTAKTSAAKKIGLSITSLCFFLGTGVFFLLAIPLSFSSILLLPLLLLTVLSPIVGIALGTISLVGCISKSRKTKERVYTIGAIFSGIASIVPIVTILVFVLLFSTGAVRISFM